MLLLWALIALPYIVSGNVEKLIFTAPDVITVSADHPVAHDTALVALSPQSDTIHALVPVQLPGSKSSGGLSSWYLLQDLDPGQRYEVRVCWVATQPTQFSLSLFSLDELVNSPDLIFDLHNFTAAHSVNRQPSTTQYASIQVEQPHSLLFLQILAAAEFFTTNTTLMNHPPPVYIDIVLDHYILSILPRSLVPTIPYILLLFLGSWYLSDFVWKWLNRIAIAEKEHKE